MSKEKKARKEDPSVAAWEVARVEGWSKLLTRVPMEMIRNYVEFLDARDLVLLLARVVPPRLEAIKPQWMSYVKEVRGLRAPATLLRRRSAFFYR